MVMKKKATGKLLARERPGTYGVDAGTAFPVSFSRSISAAEFKARCLSIMEEVRERGGEYVITKRGTPVAKLVPIPVERRPLFGSMKGTGRTLGDIVSPLDEPWEALEGIDDDV
jgi:prevent-host-death family protein